MASHEQNESLITYFHEMLAPNNLSNELKTIYQLEKYREHYKS
jgi:hypothetical protein